VWRVGAVAAVAAAVATEVVALAAKAIDIPLRAGSVGADKAEAIPAGGFAMGTLIWSAVGIVLAVVLARRAKRPARTFLVTTVVLTALSMFGPIAAGHTTTATRLVLGVSHLVAAAVVIPALTRRLAAVRAA
jgi:hypothetical protein